MYLPNLNTMADRKLSLPVLSLVGVFKQDEQDNHDDPVSPDRMYNKVERLEGLAGWHMKKTFWKTFSAY